MKSALGVGKGRGRGSKRLCVPEVPKVCRACENMKEHLNQRGVAHLRYPPCTLPATGAGRRQSSTSAVLAVVERVSATPAAVVPSVERMLEDEVADVADEIDLEDRRRAGDVSSVRC